MYWEEYRDAVEGKADEGMLKAARGSGAAIVKRCERLQAMYE